MTHYTCGICRKDGPGRLLVVKEMMLGTRDRFSYVQCQNCGTLTLSDPPQEWTRYYPSDVYYSLASTERKQSPLTLAGRLLSRAGFAGPVLADVALRVRFPLWIYDLLRLPGSARWFRGLGIRRSSSILDVGAGTGAVLHRLAEVDFFHLTGVDPFIEHSTISSDGVTLIKGTLSEVSGLFDIVMFNHSFEHMAEPRQVLSQAMERMAPNASLLIRIPVADSWAFDTYQEDWAQLDAPRHQYLFTTGSLRALAEEMGLQVIDVFRDSHAFGLYGSEQYRRNIPLTVKTVFTQADITRFGRRARQLNRQGTGDQATFVMKRSSS